MAALSLVGRLPVPLPQFYPVVADSSLLLKVHVETLLPSLAWLPGLGTVWADALGTELVSPRISHSFPFYPSEEVVEILYYKTKSPRHRLGLS